MKLIVEDETGAQRVELDADILQLQPGDMVLLCCKKRLSPDSLEAIREAWRATFPDIRVGILDGEIEATVLRREGENAFGHHDGEKCMEVTAGRMAGVNCPVCYPPVEVGTR